MGNIDDLCNLWGCFLDNGSTGNRPPYVDHKELHATIDATPLDDMPWSSFKLGYNGECPSGTVPPWMTKAYEIFHYSPRHLAQDMLSNPKFDGHVNYVPY